MDPRIMKKRYEWKEVDLTYEATIETSYLLPQTPAILTTCRQANSPIQPAFSHPACPPYDSCRRYCTTKLNFKSQSSRTEQPHGNCILYTHIRTLSALALGVLIFMIQDNILQASPFLRQMKPLINVWFGLQILSFQLLFHRRDG